MIVFVSIPIILGLVLISTAIRVWSTLRHINHGLPAFISNWREAVFILDIWHPPSILPGAESINTRFSVKHLLKNKSDIRGERAINFLLLLFIYFPAVLYRWHIKASSLLWLFVVIALWPMTWVNDESLRVKMSWRTTFMIQSSMWGISLIALLWLLSPFLPDGLVSNIKPWENSLIMLLPPPAFNLRTSLLALTLLVWFLYLISAYQFRVAYDKLLSDPEYLKKCDDELKSSFHALAKPVLFSGKWLAALMYVTVWAYSLAWALDRWPDPLQRLMWDWLKIYL